MVEISTQRNPRTPPGGRGPALFLPRNVGQYHVFRCLCTKQFLISRTKVNGPVGEGHCVVPVRGLLRGRYESNMAHIRQSRPDSGLGFSGKRQRPESINVSSQGHNLALTALFVRSSLDSGTRGGPTASLIGVQGGRNASLPPLRSGHPS